MKKLTKSQQGVVDKMKEGYKLIDMSFGSPPYLTTKSGSTRLYRNVKKNVFKAMVRNNIIEIYETNGEAKTYKLTEQ